MRRARSATRLRFHAVIVSSHRCLSHFQSCPSLRFEETERGVLQEGGALPLLLGCKFGLQPLQRARQHLTDVGCQRFRLRTALSEAWPRAGRPAAATPQFARKRPRRAQRLRGRACSWLSPAFSNRFTCTPCVRTEARVCGGERRGAHQQVSVNRRRLWRLHDKAGGAAQAAANSCGHTQPVHDGSLSATQVQTDVFESARARSIAIVFERICGALRASVRLGTALA